MASAATSASTALAPLGGRRLLTILLAAVPPAAMVILLLAVDHFEFTASALMVAVTIVALIAMIFPYLGLGLVMSWTARRPESASFTIATVAGLLLVTGSAIAHLVVYRSTSSTSALIFVIVTPVQIVIVAVAALAALIIGSQQPRPL